MGERRDWTTEDCEPRPVSSEHDMFAPYWPVRNHDGTCGLWLVEQTFAIGVEALCEDTPAIAVLASTGPGDDKGLVR
jgi:hypothetical protein